MNSTRLYVYLTVCGPVQESTTAYLDVFCARGTSDGLDLCVFEIFVERLLLFIVKIEQC